MMLIVSVNGGICSKNCLDLGVFRCLELCVSFMGRFSRAYVSLSASVSQYFSQRIRLILVVWSTIVASCFCSV